MDFWGVFIPYACATRAHTPAKLSRLNQGLFFVEFGPIFAGFGKFGLKINKFRASL